MVVKVKTRHKMLVRITPAIKRLLTIEAKRRNSPLTTLATLAVNQFTAIVSSKDPRILINYRLLAEAAVAGADMPVDVPRVVFMSAPDLVKLRDTISPERMLSDWGVVAVSLQEAKNTPFMTVLQEMIAGHLA